MGIPMPVMLHATKTKNLITTTPAATRKREAHLDIDS